MNQAPRAWHQLEAMISPRVEGKEEEKVVLEPAESWSMEDGPPEGSRKCGTSQLPEQGERRVKPDPSLLPPSHLKGSVSLGTEQGWEGLIWKALLWEENGGSFFTSHFGWDRSYAAFWVKT